jgi:hypothetical protein
MAVRTLRNRASVEIKDEDDEDRATWRMPPLALLARPELSPARRAGLALMWVYLVMSCCLVVVRVAQLALGH